MSAITESGDTAITITLPDATDADWFTPATASALAIAKVLTVKRRDATSGSSVTVVPKPTTGQTIDAATSVVMGARGTLRFVSDGANWLQL